MLKKEKIILAKNFTAELIALTDIYIDTTKEKTHFAFFHIGLSAGLISQGVSRKDAEEIILLSIEYLKKEGF